MGGIGHTDNISNIWFGERDGNIKPGKSGGSGIHHQCVAGPLTGNYRRINRAEREPCSKGWCWGGVPLP